LPSKVENRFASKVPKQGSQEQVPKTGIQARIAGIGFQGTGFQEQVPKRGYQARVPKQSSQELVCKQSVEGQEVFVGPDRWSISGLFRFISNSSQTPFRQTFVDFFMQLLLLGIFFGFIFFVFSSHRIMSCSRTFLFELFHVSAHFLRLQKWGGQRSGAVVTSTACCIGIIGKDPPIKQHKQKSRGNAQKWLKNDPLPLGSRLIESQTTYIQFGGGKSAF
jgi:hypothetical protein